MQGKNKNQIWMKNFRFWTDFEEKKKIFRPFVIFFANLQHFWGNFCLVLNEVWIYLIVFVVFGFYVNIFK